MSRNEEVEFTVVGKWPFPADMLRRDHARPKTKLEEVAIEILSREHCEAPIDIRATYEIELVIDAANARFGPNIARWNSFGWRVTALKRGGKDDPDGELKPPVVPARKPQLERSRLVVQVGDYLEDLKKQLPLGTQLTVLVQPPGGEAPYAIATGSHRKAAQAMNALSPNACYTSEDVV